MFTYENEKARLVSILDEFFGDPTISEDEFVRNDQIVGEYESHAVEDGRLTWMEIVEIHEGWIPPYRRAIA